MISLKLPASRLFGTPILGWRYQTESLIGRFVVKQTGLELC
jgi:hypothetical protein